MTASGAKRDKNPDQGPPPEPASAAGLAGLANEVKAGRLDLDGKQVVAVCTGHGLKDPEVIAKTRPQPQVLPPDLEALEQAISGE